MWIEVDIFIRKFIKRIEISVNIRKFTKWIEISVNVLNFTKRNEIGVNIQNFTKWIEISLIIRIVRIEINLTIQNDHSKFKSCVLISSQCGNLHQPYFKTVWSCIH